MISFVEGTVAGFDESGVILNVGGVGFYVQVPSYAVSELSSAPADRVVRLHTYMYIREDAMNLYGFLSADELSLFKMLITVSGIGPKGGLSLLSAMSADDLRFAIISGDAKAISRAQGIGKRTAERLVIDLKDKLQQTIGSDDLRGVHMDLSQSAAEAEGSAAGDAVAALTALGYPRADAAAAVKKAQSEGNEDTETLLKAALRHLA